MITMLSARVARVVSIIVCVTGAPLFPTSAQADEIWVPPTSQADLGGLEIASNAFWPVTPIGAVRLAWAVPNNLQTFQGAKVVLIPGGPGGTANVNIFVCAAQNGNAAAGACAGPFPQAFTGVANQLVEVEIGSSIASRIGTPGANYLAVFAYTTPTTTTDHIVGLRFAYTPTAPAGAATLGANTFTGTQTAPAFVGDGSGLTNLPTPSGVATLGANSFTGTQTAPAFAGDGSAVSNVNANLLDGVDSTAFAAAVHGHDVSQVTNAARLSGGNVFTSTQTIDTGNLDLDPSSATSGNLTKNGARFLHNFGTNNIFLGLNSGNVVMTGSGNVGVGGGTLSSVANGSANTAMGFAALVNNTTGANNTATGWEALGNNGGGNGNTAAGQGALLNVTTGSFNVGVGQNAGVGNSTGSNNVYLGAGVTAPAGESNAMYLGKVGTQNKTVIAGVRGTTVTGGEMVLIDANGRLGSGSVTPGASTIGTNEVINDSLTASDLAPDSVGSSELAADSVTAAKVAFNYASSTTEGGAAADLACVGCVAASEVSFSFAGNGANTFTATQTIDTGNLDLDDSTATTGNITKNGDRFLHDFGVQNTFLARNSGNVTMTGSLNTAIGVNTLWQNHTGSSNTAGGVGALYSNVGGDNNTATGTNSLGFNITGSANTASGRGALNDNTTGGANVAVGFLAGKNGTTGSNNIYLGANVLGVAGESNTMYLGKVGTQTTTFIAGVRGAVTGVNDAIPVVIDSNGELGTISSSRRFKEDIHDMADASRRLLKLRPVTFRYTQAYINGAKPIQYGLIAEEVAEVFPELAVSGADGQVETVHYETLNVLLLNELQEQVRLNDEQQRRIEALEGKLNALLERR